MEEEEEEEETTEKEEKDASTFRAFSLSVANNDRGTILLHKSAKGRGSGNVSSVALTGLELLFSFSFSSSCPLLPKRTLE